MEDIDQNVRWLADQFLTVSHILKQALKTALYLAQPHLLQVKGRGSQLVHREEIILCQDSDCSLSAFHADSI